VLPREISPPRISNLVRSYQQGDSKCGILFALLARYIFLVFYPEAAPRLLASSRFESPSDSLDGSRLFSNRRASASIPSSRVLILGAPFLCSPSARHATSASRDMRTAISRKRRSGFKGLARRGEERRRRSSSSAHRLSLIYITPATRRLFAIFNQTSVT
jgi:hypothetical protein